MYLVSDLRQTNHIAETASHSPQDSNKNFPQTATAKKTESIFCYAFNQFHATGGLLYPLKALGNQRFLDIFREYKRDQQHGMV